jgi:hypothetical protein
MDARMGLEPRLLAYSRPADPPMAESMMLMPLDRGGRMGDWRGELQSARRAAADGLPCMCCAFQGHCNSCITGVYRMRGDVWVLVSTAPQGTEHLRRLLLVQKM